MQIDIKPRIEGLVQKKLIGKQQPMSLANNKTKELWRSFMPRREEIRNNMDMNLYSIEVYPPFFFNNFNPLVEFNKWAAIEVTEVDSVPEGMELIILPAGLYAVFSYNGPANEALAIYQYIFSTWMPKSGFVVDERPHFAVMGEKYKNDDPSSQEEIWIPIKAK